MRAKGKTAKPDVEVAAQSEVMKMAMSEVFELTSPNHLQVIGSGSDTKVSPRLPHSRKGMASTRSQSQHTRSGTVTMVTARSQHVPRLDHSLVRRVRAEPEALANHGELNA